MKRILFLLMSAFMFMKASAQMSTVYFDDLDSKVQIGLGYAFDDKVRILSVIQKSKHDFTDFSIAFDNGKVSLQIDTIMQFGKYYECDFILPNKEFMTFMHELNGNTYVYINGNKYSALTVREKLMNIERDAMKPVFQINTRNTRWRRITVRPWPFLRLPLPNSHRMN